LNKIKRNNMKQTAVEWLVNHWKKLQSEGEKMSWQQIIDITELAKEMEKEQIKDAHNHGFTEGTCFGASPISYKFVESEKYFNETFKTKEK